MYIYIHAYIFNIHSQTKYKYAVGTKIQVHQMFCDEKKKEREVTYYRKQMGMTKYLPVRVSATYRHFVSLRWRHNGPDSVSNHQPHDCLLNRLFRRRSKKTSKLRVTGLCVGNSPGPVNSPHKGPVTRKMFPFDDVIMWRERFVILCCIILKEAYQTVSLELWIFLKELFENPSRHNWGYRTRDGIRWDKFYFISIYVAEYIWTQLALCCLSSRYVRAFLICADKRCCANLIAYIIMMVVDLLVPTRRQAINNDLWILVCNIPCGFRKKVLFFAFFGPPCISRYGH